MKRIVPFILVGLFMSGQLFGQARFRKVSTIINHPSVNAFAPLITADGNTMVFVSDNAEDNILTPFYTTRENNDWIEPIMFPKNIHTRLNFLYGFGVSADGRQTYISTLKMPSVGGYDIWVSDQKGKVWGEPKNLGAPINTKSNEASPSITTDGNTMYFMRCDKMEQSKADNCKLMVVKRKSNGQWDEPVEMPAEINTGNSQTPRIMADNETLIFSSNKMPGNKGGMDLYITRFIQGKWSTPEALDFVNTPKDDQYVSVSALGRYLLRDAAGTRKNEIVEYLIPDGQRPGGMMKLEGTVTDPDGAPTGAYLLVTDLKTGKKFYNGRPNADGSFLLYVREATTYEFAVDPEHGDYNFFSRIIDLTSDKIPQSERVTVTLKKLSKGDELALDMVTFKPYTAELEKTSLSSLQRLARVLKSDATLKVELQVMLSGYEEDSVQSNPDLTEVAHDSIAAQFDEIDSLGQLYKKDTVYVRTRYHNDRTTGQAKSIMNALMAEGISEDRMTLFVNAIAATLPEKRKLTVRARIR